MARANHHPVSLSQQESFSEDIFMEMAMTLIRLSKRVSQLKAEIHQLHQEVKVKKEERTNQSVNH